MIPIKLTLIARHAVAAATVAGTVFVTVVAATRTARLSVPTTATMTMIAKARATTKARMTTKLEAKSRAVGRPPMLMTLASASLVPMLT